MKYVHMVQTSTCLFIKNTTTNSTFYPTITLLNTILCNSTGTIPWGSNDNDYPMANVNIKTTNTADNSISNG